MQKLIVLVVLLCQLYCISGNVLPEQKPQQKHQSHTDVGPAHGQIEVTVTKPKTLTNSGNGTLAHTKADLLGRKARHSLSASVNYNGGLSGSVGYTLSFRRK